MTYVRRPNRNKLHEIAVAWLAIVGMLAVCVLVLYIHQSVFGVRQRAVPHAVMGHTDEQSAMTFTFNMPQAYRRF